MSQTVYNPRYTIYAKLQGRTEEEQLVYDREAWPGGCMWGFILWIDEMWHQFERSPAFDPGWQRMLSSRRQHDCNERR